MSYLEEAAEQLRRARNANETRAATVNSWLADGAVPVLTEVNQRRMEIADGFIRLAAIERAIPPGEPVTPSALTARVEEAIQLAQEYGGYDGEHHKLWVIDQMVRALTGCPMVEKSGTDARGAAYTYEARGEPDWYLRVVREAGGWDEGIAP